jgi:hypothetical protein
MKLIPILLFGIGVVAAGQNVSRPAASRPIKPPQVAELLAELPQCSVLKEQPANRHKSGETALDIARHQKVVESIRLLEAATPKPAKKSMP